MKQERVIVLSEEQYQAVRDLCEKEWERVCEETDKKDRTEHEKNICLAFGRLDCARKMDDFIAHIKHFLG